MEDDERRPRKQPRRDVITREVMEDMQLSVTSKARLGSSMQQKHSIFLSHSSAQKAFVRRLQHALLRNAYLPFFDEDPACLPKGELFAQRIINASRLADVAIVVLSHEFLNSKWPMIELAIFIEEQRRRVSLQACKELKVLPLFMGLCVEEFQNEELQILWQDRWCEMGVSDSRIDVSKWTEALKILGGTNGLEYRRYKDEEEYIDSILSAVFKLVSPDLKWEDSHMKGKLKFHQVVAEMFARSPSTTRFHDVRAVGLYGVGGIGKTSLCKSLCNEYRVKFDGRVWHAELGKKSAEEIQKDVLRHLVEIPETLFNRTMGCKDQWRSLLRKTMEYKVFLAIDNVWNEDESREQVEALLGMDFHADSLVIITSRSRELLEWLGIHKECCFEMPPLDKDDAMAILFHSAAPGHGIQSIKEHQLVAVDKVLERCFMTKGTISKAGSEKQYVPLALEVLGRQLRLPLGYTSMKLTEWVNNLDLKRSNQKQHPIFSVLRLSYDSLPTSKHKSIFLDVALCVPRQQDNTSANFAEVCKWLSMVHCDDAHVILEVLEDLQRYGLVERRDALESPLGMHELYCEFAKAEAATAEDNFEGQTYLYHEDGRQVPALMRWFPSHNYLPLRRIHLYNGGFRGLSCREFQYMVNVEVMKLDFCFELESLDLRCLRSLRSLELRGCFSLHTVVSLGDLKHLKFFRWNTCRNSILVSSFPPALEVVEIYGSKESQVPDIGTFGGCVGLLEMTLTRHPLLAAVSDLGKLQKLEKVDFSACCRIEEVRGLERLWHLRHLNLENCKKLRHCNGLEKLMEMQILNLRGCESLQLPGEWDLRGLLNLRNINIGGLLVVQRLCKWLPVVLRQYCQQIAVQSLTCDSWSLGVLDKSCGVAVLGSSYLEQLEVMGCRDLMTVALSNGRGSWKFLNKLNEQMKGQPRQWTVECWSMMDQNSFDACKTLNLSNCHTLESLRDIGLLTSLKYLCLQNCSMLRTLPNLSASPHLHVVDLSLSTALESLGDIGPLKALQYLYLRDCRLLRSLRDLCGASCLRVLDVSGCSKLEDLGNFDSLTSLKVLNLRECASLRTVPNLSNSPLLELLDVKGCVKLTALSHMTTSNVIIDVSECWKLERIPILNCLARLALDVTIGDADQEVVEDMELSEAVLKLKLTCQQENSTHHSLSDKVGMQLLDEPLGGMFAPMTGMFARDSNNQIAFISSRGEDVRHFQHMHRLFDSAEWTRERSVLVPYQTYTKFSSISISCKSLTEVPSPTLFATVSRLEFIKCRRLRRLANLNSLPALETLVISQCDELESLPDLRSSTSLKRLTIRDFRRGPRFQFLSYMCQPLNAYPKMWMTYPGFKSLTEVTLDGCVGLGGLHHWGPLPALESLLIKDCSTITQLPDLRRSPKLSNLTILNCGKFREAEADVVDTGHAQTLRVVRIEGCGDEKFMDVSSREDLCSELVNILGEFGALDWEGIFQLVEWVREGERRRHSLDMFSGITFPLFKFTGPT